ncbi:MAG: hypothetical protein PWP65_1414 [Clostridia bacterium]|nr:hypothetical protein [Clostridia bacterium]
MNIVQNIVGKFQRVAEMILDVLEQRMDFISFEERLREELNELGREIIREVLEACDAYLRERREEREGWEIERRHQRKNILTQFGQVTYERTYYRHKESGEYAYLVDRAAGYGPHARVDTVLKAEVIDLGTELSYRKSGQEPSQVAREAVVSGTAVMNAIRSFDVEAEKGRLLSSATEKRRVAVLYVEADEDHVPGQGGGVHLPRLVYVHEGKEQVGKKRNKLKGLHYIAGVWNDVEELWLRVWDYIDSRYDTDHIERIFICGDGDQWIKKGLSIIPRSVFVLDRFHLDKYLVAAVGRNTGAYRKVWAELREGNKAGVEAVLKKAGEQASTPSQKKAVRECWRYIQRNWEGIMAYRRYPEANIGVSAEGHVSHILAARLSSRPSAWSRQGVDLMARLRALKANGQDVRGRYIAQKKQQLKPLKVELSVVVQERQRMIQVSREVFNNLPVLGGPKTQLRLILPCPGWWGLIQLPASYSGLTRSSNF